MKKEKEISQKSEPYVMVHHRLFTKTFPKLRLRAAKENISVSEAIREAVGLYLAQGESRSVKK